MTIGLTEIHYHGLPGIDDGATNTKEALKMLEISYNEGVRRIIFTPHYYQGRYALPALEVQKKYWSFMKEIEEIKSLHILNWLDELEFYLGNEIYYSSSCVSGLSDSRIKTLANTNYVLVEFSPREDFSYIRNGCYELLNNGFFPILAHVERYDCLVNSFAKVEEICAMGVYLQVNAEAVIGGKGFRRKQFIHKLLKEEYVSFLSSDAHGIRNRTPHIQKCADYIGKKYNVIYVEELLYTNPKKLINNELILQRSFIHER